MGDAALGVISSSHYSSSGDRPANRTFVAEWQKAYGADSIPSYFAAGGWDGMAAIVSAIKSQNGDLELKRTMETLSHWSNPDSPRGPMAIDPETRDVIQNIYIRRVEHVDGALRNIDFATIPSVKDPWKELHPVASEGAAAGRTSGVFQLSESEPQQAVDSVFPAATTERPVRFGKDIPLVARSARSWVARVLRHGLRHDPVSPGRRPVRHARPDALRQPRPWGVRHDGRIPDSDGDVAVRPSVPCRGRAWPS